MKSKRMLARGSETPSVHGSSSFFYPSYDDESSESQETEDSSNEICLLFEVVSCRRLRSKDKSGKCNPYVKIKLGKKCVHKTPTMFKTAFPVFSEKTGSATILDLPRQELAKHGIDVKIKHRRADGGSTDIGSLNLTESTLIECIDKTTEFKIEAPKGSETQDVGFITLGWYPYYDEDYSDSDSRDDFSDDDDDDDDDEWDSRSDIRMERAPDKVKYFRGSESTENQEGQSTVRRKGILNVLLEIVFCRDLVYGDRTTANPYVKVKVGKSVLYQTHSVSDTLNPVFNSGENESHFSLVEVSAVSLDIQGGLEFRVKHKDVFMKKNILLGVVNVSTPTLVRSNGECQEIKLRSPKGRDNDVGWLGFRVLPQTDCRFETAPSQSVRIPDSIRAKEDSYFFSEDELKYTDLTLLLEVVSCWNLLNAKKTYVQVEQNGDTVHQTKVVLGTNEPVFTAQTDSLFFLDVLEEEFRADESLVFTVKDMKSRKTDDLGFAEVSGRKLLESNGERIELKLAPTEDMDKLDVECQGYIAIRCRIATNYDKQFMRCLTQPNSHDLRNVLGLDHGSTKLLRTKGGNTMPMIASLAGRHWRYETDIRGKKVKSYKIRPSPDPDRPKETQWMTNDEIQDEAMIESKHWYDIGSGDLGRVFLEIIGADDIKNVGYKVSGDKTDSFVTIIYEDCMASTDVIEDCLSPRWLSWMQRAFIMRIMHPSSNIMVGLFNFHGGIIGHEMLGRVAVNLAMLRPNTEYLLKYMLHDDVNTAERQSRGVITLRLRIEYENQRDLVLSHFRRLPYAEYVNVANMRDFNVARQVIYGKKDPTEFSIKNLLSHKDEIVSQTDLRLYVIDWATTIAFWRGRVRLFGRIPFPLDSLVFWLACILLVERPVLFPSFFVLSIAWFLHLTLKWRNDSPNPWKVTKTYREMAAMVLFGNFVARPHNIAPHQNLDATQEFEDKLKARIRNAEHFSNFILERNKLDKEDRKKLNMEIQQRREEANMLFSTRKGRSHPLKRMLFPIQKQLARGVYWVRFTRNVFLWEEPYYAFLLSTFLVALGILFLFVPWAWLFKWTARIIVWGLFGPHMKLVDIYWYKTFKHLSSEDQEIMTENLLERIEGVIEKRRRVLRIRQEKAHKMRDMKAIFYGQHINEVPILNTERYFDFPLHDSRARPYKARKGQKQSVERVTGQQLIMTSMLPEPKTPAGAVLVSQKHTQHYVRVTEE